MINRVFPKSVTRAGNKLDRAEGEQEEAFYQGQEKFRKAQFQTSIRRQQFADAIIASQILNIPPNMQSEDIADQIMNEAAHLFPYHARHPIIHALEKQEDNREHFEKLTNKMKRKVIAKKTKALQRGGWDNRLSENITSFL